MNKLRLAFTVTMVGCICIGLSSAPALSATRFVRPDGNDSNTGTSWDTAKKTIQSALSAAVGGGEIWVAAGTYSAYTSSSSKFIILASSTQLYGGFAGNETQRSERNPRLHPTIIDGSIDKPSPGICVPSSVTGVVIDGFIIKNCGSAYLGRGAVYCGSSVTNIIVSNNVLINNDYGVYLLAAGVTVINNTISGNSGGGIVGTLGLVANNVISGNSGVMGGGIRATGGAIINNTILGNSASIDGGGIYSDGSAIISNNIIAFNSSGVYLPNGTPALKSNCVFGNTGYNYFGIGITDPTGTNGNLSQDPLLASKAFGTAHIQPDSPCVDAGDDSALAAITADYLFDIDHQPRTIGSHVDIGADESNGNAWSEAIPLIIMVSPTGDDTSSGLTWTSAKKTIQAGIDAASATGGEVWVQSGTYNECVALKPFVYLYGGFSALASTRSDRDWAANRTIIDARRGGTVVSAFLGNSATANGGGIYSYGPFGGISNCMISGNTAACGGGVAGQCAVTGCTVTTNTATQDGGGIFGSDFVSGCTVSGNSAGRDGGGITAPGSTYTFGSIIARNTAGHAGGGICLDGTAISDTIVDNSAPQYGGVSSRQASSAAMLCDSIVALNAGPGSFSGTQYANYIYNPDNPNDPAAVAQSNSIFVGRARGNYHLQAGSPCIDTGTLYTDIFDASTRINYAPIRDMDSQKRVCGSAIDIGADEWWPGAADAKKIGDTGTCELSGVTVTATFPGVPGFFYVETDDRTSGIRVNRDGIVPSVGTKIDVSGPPITADNGERCLEASSITLTGSGSIVPLGLNNRTLGGGDFGQQEGVWGLISQKDEFGKPRIVWEKAKGVNNIGLLVTAWGKYVYVDSSTFTIDDGSSLHVKCIVPAGVTLDQSWKYLRVTGISSCEKVHFNDHDELHAIIRVRSQADIVPLQ